MYCLKSKIPPSIEKVSSNKWLVLAGSVRTWNDTRIWIALNSGTQNTLYLGSPVEGTVPIAEGIEIRNILLE